MDNRVTAPQLTARAVATGLVLGAALSFANVYIGLRTGWFFSMALVACLLSFAAWRAAAAFGLRPLGMLETNCAQSTASSAAYATGNMVVGVVPALLLLAGTQPAWPAIAAWIAASGALGVVLAIPLKQQLIDREQLPFPSGTAAAVMLRALYEGAENVRARTRWLLGGLAAGAVIPVLRDLHGVALIGRSSRVFDWLPRVWAGGVPYRASEVGLVLDHSGLLVAAGVFVGLRVATWLLVGGLLTAFVLGPHALAAGGSTMPPAAWMDVGLWAGAPMLVGYAMIAMLGNARALVTTLRAVRARGGARDADAAELPSRWFWIGIAACSVAIVVLGRALFGIPLALGCLALPASVVFAAVACRITGETDITPGGPIAKLTQLGFGAVQPGHPSTNLMIAALTHASAVASADLLNDLKSGHLLGADPRRQFLAQALGILAGTAASVAAYFLLVPDAAALLGDAPAFPAPAAHQFRAIAVLLQRGVASLQPLQQWLVAIGGGLGVVLAVTERLAPPRARRWLPSTAGLGLGLLMPVATSLSMLLGAVLAAIVVRRRADAADTTVWPIAAGVLAGESLGGVVVAAINLAFG